MLITHGSAGTQLKHSQQDGRSSGLHALASLLVPKAHSASEAVTATERAPVSRRFSSLSHMPNSKATVPAADAAADVAAVTNSDMGPAVPWTLEVHPALSIPEQVTPQMSHADDLGPRAIHDDTPAPLVQAPDCPHEHMGRSASIKAFSPFLEAPCVQLRTLISPSRSPVGGLSLASVNVTHQEANPDITQAIRNTDPAVKPEMLTLSRRGQTVPLNTIARSDLYALHQPPHRAPSQLSPFETVQKASSVSRRTSVANMLQRLSTGTDCTSKKNSPHGAMLALCQLPIYCRTSSCSRKASVCLRSCRCFTPLPTTVQDMFRLYLFALALQICLLIPYMLKARARRQTGLEVACTVLDTLTFAAPPGLPSLMLLVGIVASQRLKKDSLQLMFPEILKRGAAVDVVCFDKTGTLTHSAVSWQYMDTHNHSGLCQSHCWHDSDVCSTWKTFCAVHSKAVLVCATSCCTTLCCVVLSCAALQ